LFDTVWSVVQIYEFVSKGPGVERTKHLQEEHLQQAMEVLKVFEESTARTALSNIIEAMGCIVESQSPRR
jgi:decaprenyl-diphosphate synthase subunit 2